MRSVLLALPAKESAHGYELKQAWEQTFGSADPSPGIGHVYVTLGRLEKDALFRGENVTQSNRPNKRVRELTPTGLEAVAEWLDAPGEGPRPRSEFFTKLSLVPLTGATDRMSLINRQRRHCLNLMRGLSEPGHPGEGDNRVASPLVEGARPHLEWRERCREALS
ncbi:PadR family transcriptional regulator [Actinoallomurus acaciae]|uniref:PadR family transcriptional regulator n=1 Tax=Actinoallomurus acaciae TaxID=502577 RepID=A0ABV5YBM0_9ACTN